MTAFLPRAVALALLTTAGVAQPPAAGASEAAVERSLMDALRNSDAAEIYILRRDLDFVVAPRPDTVRTLGCRYLVRRNSAPWRELEASLGAADIRIVAAEAGGEVRVGLVLSDRQGILFEAYSRWPSGSETRVNGLSQRRRVAVSASFAAALERFAQRHRDLAIPIANPVAICPPAA